MGRRKPYVDQELTFAPKISKTSKRIALRLSEHLETKGVPHFMRETKSKKLTLEPIAYVPVTSRISKERQTLGTVDADVLFDDEQALATSRPLLPCLVPDKNGVPGRTIAVGKLAATGPANVTEEGLKTVDPFSSAMSKNACLPARSIQLDETVFTFRPKVSSASAKIAENLGTDFMSRQQMHLEKQKRLLEQSSQQLRFPSHLASTIRRRDGREVEDVNNSALQPDAINRDNMPNTSAHLTFANDTMADTTHNSGAKMCEGDSTTTTTTRLQGLFSETELTDSLTRSKTMPNLGRPKLNRKLSTFNDGERLRLAKDMVEKAIKYRKVFTIQGGYSNIRHSLRRRGWVEKFYKIPSPPSKTPRTKKRKNASDDDDDDDGDDDDDDDDDGADTDDDDNDEPKIAPWDEDDGVYGIMSRMLRNTNPSFFWVLKRDVIDYRFLNRDQTVNHYCKAGSFTTKVGLCMNMKNVPWFENADPNTFFPRCYRLSHDEEKQAFIDDFRLTACMNILKFAANRNMNNASSAQDDVEEPPSTAGGADVDNSQNNSATKDTDQKSACTNPACPGVRQAGKEGSIKCTCPQQTSTQENKPGTANASGTDGKCGTKKSGEESGGGKEGQSKAYPRCVKPVEKKKKKRVLVPLRILETAIVQCEKFLSERDHEDIDRHEDSMAVLSEGQWEDLITWYYQLVHEDGTIASVSQTILIQVESLINRLRTKWPQFDMDGAHNVWIVKPGAKSRGRGITCYNRLDDMLKLVSSQVVKKDGKYVVQKYMERPLLVYNTKFDIRQWFLVTDWNPLTLWFYEDSYLRFCSQQYTLDDFDQSIHLSNNAIQKYCKNGPRSSKLPPENMWTHEEFKEYLKGRKQPNAWDEIIYPGMKRAIICALLCTQDIVEYRKSSFELYGADFMLTEDLQPWLIEINSSPSMEASTAVTARLCKNVLDDTIKVTVDRKYDRNCDIGAFELAYKQPVVTVPPYIGISLSVDGQSMRKPAGFGVRRLPDPSQPTDFLFTPRPALRQINHDRAADDALKKTSSGPVGLSSAGTHVADVKRKCADSPDNGSVNSCPPKTGRGVSESSSMVVQIDGKSGGASRLVRTSEGIMGNKPDKGDSIKSISELKVPSTQTFPPSKVVYTQHTPVIGEAGNKRIVSKTSVSSNYTVPHPPPTASSSSSRSMVVNNVESTDLKTFKPTKGRVNPSYSCAWQGTCSECGSGKNLRLEVSNRSCRCQQDSVVLVSHTDSSPSSVGLLLQSANLRPHTGLGYVTQFRHSHNQPAGQSASSTGHVYFPTGQPASSKGRVYPAADVAASSAGRKYPAVGQSASSTGHVYLANGQSASSMGRVYPAVSQSATNTGNAYLAADQSPSSMGRIYSSVAQSASSTAHLYPGGPAAGLPLKGLSSPPLSTGEKLLQRCPEGWKEGPAHYLNRPTIRPQSKKKTITESLTDKKKPRPVPKSRLSLALSLSARSWSGVGFGSKVAKSPVYWDTSQIYSPLCIMSRSPEW